MGDFPLNGIRVVDLGQSIAVPIATRELALLGAEVIHIESTKRTDVTRFGTPLDNQPSVGEFWNQSGRYNTVNTNKKSLTLDLSTQQGRDIIKKLVKLSDVVTENWSPRVKKNLGLDYEDLKKIRPDIILVSASGYGDDGPWANWVAWGMGIDPMCGLTELTGFADGPPVKGSPPLCDFIAASYVTLAVLVSLEYRRRTSKGQWVDISDLEVGACHIGPAIMDYTMNRRVETRIGNRHPFIAPHGCYRCKGDDNWVAIAVSSDTEWNSLCDVMGNPEWTKHDKFSNNFSRCENQDELDRLIEVWTISQDHYEVMGKLQKVGVPAGAVLNMKEVLLDRHAKERNCYQLVSHPRYEGTKGLGTRLYPRLPWRMSRSSLSPVQPAPRLGEHNKYVLGNLLGMSDEEIAGLESQGIIGTVPLAVTQPGVHQTSTIPEMLEQGVIRGYDPDYLRILGIKKEE